MGYEREVNKTLLNNYEMLIRESEELIKYIEDYVLKDIGTIFNSTLEMSLFLDRIIGVSNQIRNWKVIEGEEK